MDFNHRKAFYSFLAWPLIAAFISFNFPINFFLSSFIFFGVPAAILSLLKPNRVKKAAVASLIFTPIGLVIDYVAQINGTWKMPLPDTVFPFKFLDVVSIEGIIWGFLHVYAVIMYFSYFSEKQYIKTLWNKKSEEALALFIGIFLLFLVTLLFLPDTLKIPYWYIIFGLVSLLSVVVLEEIRFPKVFPRLLRTAFYFFYLNFVYEIVALKLNWWSFPSGRYVGYVSVLDVSFPLEEFVFWMILFSLAILSVYEYFFNGER